MPLMPLFIADTLFQDDFFFFFYFHDVAIYALLSPLIDFSLMLFFHFTMMLFC